MTDDDVYRCPAAEALTRRFTSVEDGMNLYVYWTSKCAGYPLKSSRTSGKELRIKCWEHEKVIDAMPSSLNVSKLLPSSRTSLEAQPPPALLVVPAAARSARWAI